MTFNLLCRLRQKIYLKKLRALGLEIAPSFYVSDMQNIRYEAPVYIGPNSWMELRGKLYIGSGTIIGPRLKVLTSNHNYQGSMLPYDDKYIVKDIHVKKMYG